LRSLPNWRYGLNSAGFKRRLKGDARKFEMHPSAASVALHPPMPVDSAPALLEVAHLRKSFPGVLANDDVSFAVAGGTIHALLGENGAGKSTLVKMIYGVMRPDAGAMRIDGRAHAPANPGDARRAGIGMVFQHFTLFESLTVAENIALGLPADQAKSGLLDRIQNTARDYGLAIDPHRLVGTLSVGERQRVEIVRCLLQRPRLVIMDEPTSVLTPQEVDSLFLTLKRIRDEGCSVLYISHKLDEIRVLCDSATILRGGRVVASCDPRGETPKSLAEMMLGSTLSSTPRRSGQAGVVRLAVHDLSLAADHPFGTALAGISFEVRAGEILGIAGVAGNGQFELMEALIGERFVSGKQMIVADGQSMRGLGPHERRAHGLAFVPEERLGHAAVPALSLVENTILSARGAKQLERNGIIDTGAAQRFTADIVSRFMVKAGSIHATARSLSGGNLQKFIVGREVLQNPGILVVSQPTWGVDAGAAAAIHAALFDLAARGSAILIISQDLEELLTLSDRVAVMAGGRLSLAKPVSAVTLEDIGRQMGAIGADRADGAKR
jgi:general nucleoside transport system ATP-binding protein